MKPMLTLCTTLFAVSLPLALSSCSSEQPQSSRPGATTTTTQTDRTTTTSTATNTTVVTSSVAAQPAAAAQVATATPFSTQQQQQAAHQADLTISDVRVGTHEGYDRVVMEYSGPGTPGFFTSYVDTPLQQASALPLDVAGNAYLELMIHGTPMANLSANQALVKTGPMALETGNIAGITHGGVFEAATQYVIGLDRARAYHAYTLENPPRVVVDIQR